MQVPANSVVDKATRLANGSTVLPVKPSQAFSPGCLETTCASCGTCPAPSGTRPKTCNHVFGNRPRNQAAFRNSGSQSAIPSQTLPNDNNLTSYDLGTPGNMVFVPEADTARHCILQGQDSLGRPAHSIRTLDSDAQNGGRAQSVRGR